MTRDSEQIAINIKAEIGKRSIARVRKSTSVTSGIHSAIDLSPIGLRNGEIHQRASRAGIYHPKLAPPSLFPPTRFQSNGSRFKIK